VVIPGPQSLPAASAPPPLLNPPSIGTVTHVPLGQAGPSMSALSLQPKPATAAGSVPVITMSAAPAPPPASPTPTLAPPMMPPLPPGAPPAGPVSPTGGLSAPPGFGRFPSLPNAAQRHPQLSPSSVYTFMLCGLVCVSVSVVDVLYSNFDRSKINGMNALRISEQRVDA
jgi:hypothetical protein